MSAESARTPTVEKLLSDARKGNAPAVAFLVGSEDFLLRQALAEYLAVIAPPDVRDFDFTQLRGESVDGNTLYNALTTLPFMAPKRVVVLDDALKLDEAPGARLAKYLSSPSPSTLLVMVQVTDPGNRPPAIPTGKLFVLRFDGLREPERIAWAVDFCKRHGKSLSREASQYLIESSSAELTDLSAKLVMAILYVGDVEEITPATLLRVSGVTSEFTVFNLTDAILKGQRGEACRMAKSLLDGGEALLGLLGFQRRFLIKLWQVGSVDRHSKGADLEARKKAILGGQAWKSHEFTARARALGEQGLRRAVSGLLDVEILAKNRSGESGARARYFEWLYETCRPAGSTSEPKFRNRSILLSA
ncbi:DNA polymerase III subunit delta [candidate division KSB1 bacterium]|nr:DNA polymerase III subunit delta [candidate division KSB1 bacterium]